MTSWIVSNSAEISCSTESCKNAVFVLTANVGGSILCDGASACLQASISISDVSSIICGGIDSCKNARFTVTDPRDDFSISCKCMS